MLRVVKLGGSLHREPELKTCLEALASVGEDVVLVPGGGPFADTVRKVQAQSKISDAAAHDMAMLAMEQYGLMLCDLNPGLVPVASLDNIHHTLKQGLMPVWLPSVMCRNAVDIPQNWSVSSDSLAVWLAIQLSASNLTLIKYGRPANTDPVAMAVSGWVDDAFPFFAKRFGGTLHILDFQEVKLISGWLAQQD
jgi:aspartokinase-like uncharacterized kinase